MFRGFFAILSSQKNTKYIDLRTVEKIADMFRLSCGPYLPIKRWEVPAFIVVCLAVYLSSFLLDSQLVRSSGVVLTSWVKMDFRSSRSLLICWAVGLRTSNSSLISGFCSSASKGL